MWYFSANSRWVAALVSTAVNTSYFCEGAKRTRGLRTALAEPLAASGLVSCDIQTLPCW